MLDLLLPRGRMFKEETYGVLPHIEWLAAELDVRCRLIPVLLELWETPWPEGESAPRLDCCDDGSWALGHHDWRVHFLPPEMAAPEDEPWDLTVLRESGQYLAATGLDTFTEQRQANDAAEHIIRTLLETPCPT